ncbi:MAG TPA: hypothetical protein VHG88_05005 [Burkholderiales bacterium]|nr:hypothetical protein [Burkholderiales bacterium]
MRLSRAFGITRVQVLQHRPGEGAFAPRCHRNVACRVLAQDEVLAFAVDTALELDEAWVRSEFALGAVCLGAVEGGRLLGYTWLAYVDADLRYSHKSFVRPGYRRQRVLSALHALADRTELWRGRRASVSFVEADDATSLALQRAGSRSLGYAVYAKVFGTLIAWRSAGVRRAGIRLYAPPPAGADRMQPWPDQSPHSSA